VDVDGRRPHPGSGRFSPRAAGRRPVSTGTHRRSAGVASPPDSSAGFFRLVLRGPALPSAGGSGHSSSSEYQPIVAQVRRAIAPLNPGSRQRGKGGALALGRSSSGRLYQALAAVARPDRRIRSERPNGPLESCRLMACHERRGAGYQPVSLRAPMGQTTTRKQRGPPAAVKLQNGRCHGHLPFAFRPERRQRFLAVFTRHDEAA